MDHTNIKLDKKDIKELLNKLSQLYQVTTFSYEQFNKYKDDDEFTLEKDDWPGINLIEAYTIDILKITQYETSLVNEYNKRYEKVREANNKIRDLEKRLGEKVNIQDISYGIKNYVSEINKKIFGYSKISFDDYGGIVFDISYRTLFSTLSRHDNEDGGYKSLLKELKEDLGLELIENDDGYKDEIHYDILDTEDNRIALENYFVKTFGINATVNEFKSSRGRIHKQYIINSVIGYSHFRNINLS